MKKRKVLFRGVYHFLILLLILSESLWSQVQRINFIKEQESKRQMRETQEILQESDLIKQRISKRKTIEEALYNLDVIDKWVKPDSYLVGAGDILAINIGGSVNQYLEVLVSPQGRVDIPGMGSIDVRGATLTEVEQKVQQVVNEYFKDTEVYCNLVGLRPIKVYVLGEVYSPGAYIAKPVDRVFDIINKTGGMKDLAKAFDVRLKRDGKVERINGFDYLFRGDMSANPYVREGDVIYVPKAIPYKETVTIQGGFLKPGIYPVKEGESLYDFLIRQSNFSENAELNSISITRGDGDRRVVKINPDEQEPLKVLKSVKIKGGDIIEIGVLNEVYVQGEVKVPGAYPYVAGFKAIDYIGLAGGNTFRGSASRVKIYHADGSRGKGLHEIIYRGDVIVVPESISYSMVGQLSTLQIVYYLASTLLTIEVIRTR